MLFSAIGRNCIITPLSENKQGYNTFLSVRYTRGRCGDGVRNVQSVWPDN